MWTSKVAKHYRRLLKPLYLEGLMKWRRCALGLHRAGLPVHSGTICVERQWAQNRSYWPPQTRQVTEPTFHLLSDMCFLRFQWTHYHKPSGPSWTRGDVLLQQRALEMLAMLEASRGSLVTPIEQELACQA